MRKEYTREALSEADVDADPVVQFGRWFEQAEQSGLLEPTAMTLATATLDGRPSARMVLLRGFDERGFCFYTNYQSRKGRAGRQPAGRPGVLVGRAGTPGPHRGPGRPDHQGRERGLLPLAPAGQPAQRGRLPQSRVIDGRAVLERRVTELATGGRPAPPARLLGGYRLAHEVVEFWQGRPNRLHDRLRYRRAGDTWKIERLAP